MRIVKSILLMCLLIFAITCSKDEDEIDKISTSKLTIEENEYDLIHGEITNSGEIDPPGNIYGFLVYILTSEFTFTETNVNGTGQAIELHFWTDMNDGLKPGTYKLFEEENPDINTFICNISTNLNQENWEMGYLYSCISGTINIEKNGSIYTITADILTNKYDTEFFSEAPKGDPIARDIRIFFNFTGKLSQKYFS